LFDLYDDTDTVEGVKWSTYKKKNETLAEMQGTLGNLGDQIKMLNLNAGGGHQRVMSIKGEKFDVKKKPTLTKIVTLDGTNIKGMDVKQQVQTQISKNTNTGESSDIRQDEKDESQNVHLTDNNNQNTADTLTNSKSDAAIGPDANFHTIRYDSPVKSTARSGDSKFTDVLKLIQSFTEDYLTNNGVKSMKTLHEKMKYYSLFHREKPELLMCEAQPFYMRFSIMGEMFLVDD